MCRFPKEIEDEIWSYGPGHSEKWRIVMEELRYYFYKRRCLEILMIESVVEAIGNILDDIEDEY